MWQKMLMHNKENQMPSCLIFKRKACGDNDVDFFVMKKIHQKVVDISRKHKGEKESIRFFYFVCDFRPFKLFFTLRRTATWLMPREEAAAGENRRSSSVIWEFWSLLVAAESSRGGSHLAQLLPCTQLGVLSILTVWRTSPGGRGVARSLTDVSL